MYAATGGPNMKWRAQLLNGGTASTVPPAWRRPRFGGVPSKTSITIGQVVSAPTSEPGKGFRRSHSYVTTNRRTKLWSLISSSHDNTTEVLQATRAGKRNSSGRTLSNNSQTTATRARTGKRGVGDFANRSRPSSNRSESLPSKSSAKCTRSAHNHKATWRSRATGSSPGESSPSHAR